jgi:hypothetical protein
MINNKLKKERFSSIIYYNSVLIFFIFLLIFLNFYFLILNLFFIELSYSHDTDHGFKRLTRFGRLIMLARVFFN